MLKLVVAVLAVALAGTASAAKWRDLRVDGSSEEAFAQSLEAFKDKLSPARRYTFGEALKDIWMQGAKAAEAEQREYTASEYYADVDGLSYEEIVTLTDPTGDTAKTRYREASLMARGARPSGAGSPPSNPYPSTGIRGLDAPGLAQQQQQMGTLNPNGALGGIQN
jgi:hypothetical protein